jgi:hypothetical protein
MTHVTYDQPGPTLEAVRAAAREYVADNAGAVDLFSAYDGLAQRLSVNTRPRTTGQGKAWTRFQGQVRRAFDQLAEAGELRKVGKDATGPDGYKFDSSYAGEPRYFTPAAYEAAQQADRDIKDARRRTAEHWTRTRERLAALGMTPKLGGTMHDHQRPVDLELTDWDPLLDLAERARRDADAAGAAGEHWEAVSRAAAADLLTLAAAIPEHSEDTAAALNRLTVLAGSLPGLGTP